MLAQIKKYLEDKKIIKGSFKSRVFSACKKVTASSCIVGLVMITNTSFARAYEAHTVNVTARIINNIPKIIPPGGEFCVAGEFLVELSVSLDGADIYYTTDGSDPVCGGNKYTVPFALPDTPGGIVTVKAAACHSVTRNTGTVLIQSAIMEKEFNSLAPIVNVIINDYEYKTSGNIPVWYCNSTYRVNWEIGNYRQGSVADVIYIVDKDNNKVIGAGDEVHFVDQNLPTGETGEYSLEVDFSKGYCHLGYAWVKIIVTEPNGCGGSGISEIIYEPMPPADDSCDNSAPASVSAFASAPASVPDDNIPAVPETEPAPESVISGDNDIPGDTEDISDDDLDGDLSLEDGGDGASEDAEDGDNDDDSDPEEDITSNREDDQEDEGIIISREDDKDDDTMEDDIDGAPDDDADDGENNSDDSDGSEDDDDDDVDADGDNIPDDIDDENIGNDDDDADDGETDDGVSVDELPITPDDDSTIIEISI